MNISQIRSKKVCENGRFFIMKNATRYIAPKMPVNPVLSGLSHGRNSDKESSPVVGKFLHSRM